jgi:hypothetical protein
MKQFLRQDARFRDVDFTNRQSWWSELPVRCEGLREEGTKVREILRCIHDMSSDRGVARLQEAAGKQKRRITVKYPGPHNIALTYYLRAEDLFWDVWAVCGIEDLDEWRNYMGEAEARPQLSPKALGGLEQSLVAYLKRHRIGQQCVVQAYDLGERVVLEISHEDRERARQWFRRRTVMTGWWHPVVHEAAVYYPRTGHLKLRAARSSEPLLRECSRQIGEHLFGDPDMFERVDQMLQLNVLCEDPKFLTDPCHRISSVRIAEMTFRLRHGAPDRLLSVGLAGTDSVGGLLAEFGIDREGIEVTEATLRFKFPGHRLAGYRTVKLQRPHTTNLSDRLNDRIIEHYLREWGILVGEGLVADDAPLVEPTWPDKPRPGDPPRLPLGPSRPGSSRRGARRSAPAERGGRAGRRRAS